MAELRAFEPSWRDRLAGWMMGNERATPERRRMVEGLLGSSGLGNTGVGLVDVTPVGGLLGAQEAARDGDYRGAAMNAMFLGPAAKTANKVALKAAEEMAAKGASRDAIWNETGWFKGVDGKWRFEIPDNQAVALNNLRPMETHFLGESIPYRGGEVGDVINHQKLFEAYPDTKKITVGETFYKDGTEGVYNYSPVESIGLQGSVIDGGSPLTTLHELQHAVQAREGFSRGSTPSYYKTNPAENPAVKLYQDALQNNKLMQELQSLQNSPLRERELAQNNELWNRDFEPRYKELQNIRESGDYERLAPQIEALFQEFKEVEKTKFPTLTRIDELATLLRRDNIPLSEPKQYLDPVDAYRRTAGEVEARNVEKRMSMTPDERRATPPWATQDVPDELQIIRSLLAD